MIHAIEQTLHHRNCIYMLSHTHWHKLTFRSNTTRTLAISHIASGNRSNQSAMTCIIHRSTDTRCNICIAFYYREGIYATIASQFFMRKIHIAVHYTYNNIIRTLCYSPCIISLYWLKIPCHIRIFKSRIIRMNAITLCHNLHWHHKEFNIIYL